MKIILIVFFFTLSSTLAFAQVHSSTSTDKTENYYSELMQHANTLKVIDAHEHLLSAEDHTKKYLCFYNFLSDYVRWDLYSAGVPKEYLNFKPANEADAIKIFNVIEPYLPFVENGSYMLSVKIALKKYFNVEKITRDNYLEISRKLNVDNTVENYHAILKEARIVTVLEQSIEGNPKEKEFVNLTPLGFQFKMEEKLSHMCRANRNMTLKDVVAYYDRELKKEKESGSIGIKFFPHVFIEPYDTVVAKEEFEKMKLGKPFNQRSTLARYIYEEQIRIATKYKMVVAIHLGVWSDLTDKNPAILFPIVSKYPEATFDIYHMGIPFIRETAFLGKNYPNVYLNLCWAYSVSESMVLNSLDEWIDIVPTNKIIGFGGDVITLPQHAVGMLEVAKHVLCTVLAKRIANSRMDMPGAKKILEDWLYNNPAKVYGIK